MKKLFIFTRIITRRFMRNKTAVFFTFLFPVVFLIVFGFIFKGNGGASFDVAVFNRSNTEFSKTFIDDAKKAGIITVKEMANEDAARQSLSRGAISGYIVLPEDFGTTTETGQPKGNLIVKFSQSNEQTGRTLAAVLKGYADGTNQKISPYSPPITITAEAQKIAKLSRFDYTLSGLLGFSLMSLGVFGVVNGFVSDKKTGAIGRLRVTPLKAWELILATAFNRIIIAFISVIIMLVVAAVLFGFRMHGNWPSFIIVVALSATLMLGVGLALGGWAKSEDEAAPLANLVTLPMMFLSGVFIPTYLMPLWLQNVSKYIPLSPVVDSLRQILTEGKTIFNLGPQLLIICVWTVIVYFIASLVFRWE